MKISSQFTENLFILYWLLILSKIIFCKKQLHVADILLSALYSYCPLLKQLIHINQSLEEIEKIQEVEELKLDTLNPKQIILKEKLEIEENKLEELNLEKNKNKKTSVNKIDKLITKIEVLFSKQKQEINNLKTNLQNQTTTINEELVIEL